MSILLVDPLLVFLELVEPAGIFGLFHDDLDTRSRSVQLVVDRVEELFGGVNRLATSAALIVPSRGWIECRRVPTQLVVQCAFTLLRRTLSFQRVL